MESDIFGIAALGFHEVRFANQSIPRCLGSVPRSLLRPVITFVLGHQSIGKVDWSSPDDVIRLSCEGFVKYLYMPLDRISTRYIDIKFGTFAWVMQLMRDYETLAAQMLFTKQQLIRTIRSSTAEPDSHDIPEEELLEGIARAFDDQLLGTALLTDRLRSGLQRYLDSLLGLVEVKYYLREAKASRDAEKGLSVVRGAAGKI